MPREPPVAEDWPVPLHQEDHRDERPRPQRSGLSNPAGRQRARQRRRRGRVQVRAVLHLQVPGAGGTESEPRNHSGPDPGHLRQDALQGDRGREEAALHHQRRRLTRAQEPPQLAAQLGHPAPGLPQEPQPDDLRAGHLHRDVRPAAAKRPHPGPALSGRQAPQPLQHQRQPPEGQRGPRGVLQESELGGGVRGLLHPRHPGLQHHERDGSELQQELLRLQRPPGPRGGHQLPQGEGRAQGSQDRLLLRRLPPRPQRRLGKPLPRHDRQKAHPAGAAQPPVQRPQVHSARGQHPADCGEAEGRHAEGGGDGLGAGHPGLRQAQALQAVRERQAHGKEGEHERHRPRTRDQQDDRGEAGRIHGLPLHLREGHHLLLHRPTG
mmetsp:Transcript_132/g.249  ORF Transcript_132/g.249 Transcript_132/m.249 type:complete len:380 (+) Transcript_132:693-1832(+)